jgi:methylase of polypeptide subunit release factors
MRYSNATKIKTNGVVYTPRELAEYLVANMFKHVNLSEKKQLSILDPAIGDGELVIALINEIKRNSIHFKITVVGFEIDANVVPKTIRRLIQAHPDVIVNIRNEDFLSYASGKPDECGFDFIIANPPYIRTQVMGADKAQAISRNARLSGRVDAYYAFLVAADQFLRDDGVAGFITSNKFMSVKSGAKVREYLYEKTKLLQITDFGDTKLFDAAVLPCTIIFSRGRSDDGNVEFISMYESSASRVDFVCKSIFDAISKNGIVQIYDGRRFEIKHGVLSEKAEDSPWYLTSASQCAWLDHVDAVTWKRFSDIGKIRVGIKTTADNVFIGDWEGVEKLPELLMPLITHRNSGQIIPRNSKYWKVLYTHTIQNGKRTVYDIDDYPITMRYLEQHKPQLAKRKYIEKANRLWYEIWVPQNPASWKSRKIVFRDIAEKPEFWLDDSGAIVNGDCYWIEIRDDITLDELYLALAVANSSFIEKYYDTKFNNKLYSGKRRFMTQYVSDFPLPNVSMPNAQRAIDIVRSIILEPTKAHDQRRAELNCVVDAIFA